MILIFMSTDVIGGIAYEQISVSVFYLRHTLIQDHLKGDFKVLGFPKVHDLTVHSFTLPIILASPCNLCPLTHHFYIVKMGFTGVYVFFFFFFALKHRSWVRVPTIYVLSKNMKIVKKINLKL